jgi:hypothetical protein
VTDDLRDAIADALREHGIDDSQHDPAQDHDACLCGPRIEDWDEHWADVVLAAIHGQYVPPPPGSDRDKLPDRLLAVIGPHMRPYLSTGCQTANALEMAAGRHPDMAGELREWAERMRASCRQTRKQDMARCRHAQHQDAAP